MKASDSTNSLTGLTEHIAVEIEEKSCFICLEVMNENNEPLVDSSLLRTCGCQFKVHPACWNEWMKGKTDYDCPICRKKSLTLGKTPTPPIPVSEWGEDSRPCCKRHICMLPCLLFFIGACIMIYEITHDKS